MTSMLLTRKIRIAPTMAQIRVLWALSEKCRLLYNFALAERRHQWATTRTQPPIAPTPITYTQQQNALPALKARGVNRPCPRCGNQGFAVQDGYFKHPVQDTIDDMVLGGPAMPTAVTVCDRCGYISQHALGALGLLPKK